MHQLRIIAASTVLSTFALGQCELAAAPMPTGFDGIVRTLARADEDVYVGGEFTNAPGIPAARIARFDGTSFHAMGAGITGIPGWAQLVPGAPYVEAMLTLPNGDLIASGPFTHADGIAVNGMARWNGSSWSAMGDVDSFVHALARMPNGDLIAAGRFGSIDGVPASAIARFSNGQWSELGGGLSGGLFGTAVFDLVVTGDGDLIAVGQFSNAGGTPVQGVARWDGSSWSAFGSSLQGIFLGEGHVEATEKDTVIVSGLLQIQGTLHFVAEWDGATWTPIDSNGTLWPRAIHALPNGDLIAHGQFQINGAPTPIGRWDGSQWEPAAGIIQGVVYDIETSGNGELMLGGDFQTAFAQPQSNLTRIATPCPADVVWYGPWCPSSGGDNWFTSDDQPWLGTTFTARATGLPDDGSVAIVTGFGTDCQFLTPTFPNAGSNCFLLVEPSLIDFATIDSGTVRVDSPIPHLPALAGLAVHQQLVVFEVDNQGSWISTTATNALTLTLGAF